MMVLSSLARVQEEVVQNILTMEGNCKDCPLVRYRSGPVFFEHVGMACPRIVIISESPAGYKKARYDFSGVDIWKGKILRKIKTFRWEKFGQMNRLSKFLAGLTDNKMVADPGNMATINDIYWTHAVKCFIQQRGQKKESVKGAKDRLRSGFDEAGKCCREYLSMELKAIRPELIVAVGGKALHALVPKEKNLIGESIQLPKTELVFTYHPSATLKDITLKEKGFNHARDRIRIFLMKEEG